MVEEKHASALSLSGTGLVLREAAHAGAPATRPEARITRAGASTTRRGPRAAPPPAPLWLRRALRTIVALGLRCFLRLRVRGEGQLPAQGPAMVVCNHVSYLDALVLASACPYPLRFVYWHRLARVPLLGTFLRLVGGIAIAAEHEDAALYHGALDAIDEALAAGEVVAVFPEGKLTKDGEVGTFRRGVERMLARRPVPVVPAALRGLYGSPFSRAPKKHLPRPGAQIELVVAPALAPQGLSAALLQDRVCALRGATR